MFRDSSGVAAITQTENFGTWGESLKSLNYYRGAVGKERFVFTGHERDDDLGVYDAKARMYDPLVPRFWSQDVLSELSRRFSPYNYSFNNPTMFIDPDGMMANEHYEGAEAQAYVQALQDDDNRKKSKNNTIPVLDQPPGGGKAPQVEKFSKPDWGTRLMGAVGRFLGTAFLVLMPHEAGPKHEFINQLTQEQEDRLAALEGMRSAKMANGEELTGQDLTDYRELSDAKYASPAARLNALPNVVKTVNSNLPHAIDRGIERGIFLNRAEASTILKDLSTQISKHGFPAGSFKDPSYLDRVLVPVGNGGLVSYQVGKNGTAVIKTVLIAR